MFVCFATIFPGRVPWATSPRAISLILCVNVSLLGAWQNTRWLLQKAKCGAGMPKPSRPKARSGRQRPPQHQQRSAGSRPVSRSIARNALSPPARRPRAELPLRGRPSRAAPSATPATPRERSGWRAVPAIPMALQAFRVKEARRFGKSSSARRRPISARASARHGVAKESEDQRPSAAVLLARGREGH